MPLFPKVPDYHKPDRPMIYNGLGVIYVLVSVVYLFLIYFFDVVKIQNGVSPPLTLAVCILFGGFLGMLDDWIDLKWRYKAFLPLVAAIPLVTLAYRLGLRTAVSLPFLGTIDFGSYYYFLLIPLLVMIITNTVNQLGGLNGLETVCPAVILVYLFAVSGASAVLLYAPLGVWLILGALNFLGKIFVGNTGSFAIGMTLVSFAIVSDLKLNLIISVLPYLFNSSLILLTFFLYGKKGSLTSHGEKWTANHRRSLLTLIAYGRCWSERQIVATVAVLVATSSLISLLLQWLSH